MALPKTLTPGGTIRTENLSGRLWLNSLSASRYFRRGLTGQEAAVPIVGYYDFSKLKTDEKDRVELVDVGGGQGQS